MIDPQTGMIFTYKGTDTTLWVSEYAHQRGSIRVAILPLFPVENASRLPTEEELGKNVLQGARLFEPYALEGVHLSLVKYLKR